MKPPLTAPALVQLLHRYYPAGLWCDDPAYKASTEAQRLTLLLESAQKNTRAWEHFVQQVREEFSGSTLWDTTLLWIDPCYRLRVSLPGATRPGAEPDVLVCLVSLLVPAYVIYDPRLLATESSTESGLDTVPVPPRLQPDDAKLASMIESSFGASRLPSELLFLPVPELAPRTGNVALGKARLSDLLFTPDL